MRRTRNLEVPPFGQDNVTIHVFGPECLARDIHPADNVTASAAWTDDLCIFIPLLTRERLVVTHMFWHNGAAVSGDTDVAIYNEDASAKIGGTGPTANSGVNLFQSVNVTDFQLAANALYWLALGCDNVTQAYLMASLVVAGLDYIGVKQQAAGYSGGLPTPATMAVPTVGVIPLFGFTGASVI